MNITVASSYFIVNKTVIHLFFYKRSIFDPRRKHFLKNRPKKLLSNCFVDGLLVSIV